MTSEGNDMQKDREYRERRQARTRAYNAAPKDEAGGRGRRRNLAQRLAQRWRRLQRRYGLSRDDYEALLARQGGACGICKQPRPNRLSSIAVAPPAGCA